MGNDSFQIYFNRSLRQGGHEWEGNVAINIFPEFGEIGHMQKISTTWTMIIEISRNRMQNISLHDVPYICTDSNIYDVYLAQIRYMCF